MRAKRLYLRPSYLIGLDWICSFVDCGFRVRVSSRVRVSVSFIFLAFFLSHVGQKSEKLTTRLIASVASHARPE